MKKEIERKKRAQKLVRKLKELYPNPESELTWGNNWELLVAIILSAQCTDKRVNEETAKLFKKYRKLEDYVNTKPLEFEKDIFATGFYRNKTKNILAAAKLVKKKYKGRLPKTMEEMLTIPGVARKTANVFLGNAYGIYPGIAVDTHVKRLARKFDLTDNTNPDKIEKDLMHLIPEKEWPFVNHSMVLYGRYICPARKHDCIEHPLTQLWPPAGKCFPKASE